MIMWYTQQIKKHIPKRFISGGVFGFMKLCSVHRLWTQAFLHVCRTQVIIHWCLLVLETLPPFYFKISQYRAILKTFRPEDFCSHERDSAWSCSERELFSRGCWCSSLEHLFRRYRWKLLGPSPRIWHAADHLVAQSGFATRASFTQLSLTHAIAIHLQPHFLLLGTWSHSHGLPVVVRHLRSDDYLFIFF